MAWANSKVFRATIADVFGNTTALDLDSAADTPKVALYNNSITPDQNVTSANTAYNVGQWANTNELSNGGWSAGGLALASKSLDSSVSAVVFYDAADTANGSAATLSGVFGCLVYDDTLTTPVADQGICYNYFGGTNSVTAGTFTVVWNANGIWRATL